MCTVSASYQALEIGLIAGPGNRHHIRPQLIVVVVVFVVAVFVAPSSPSSLPSSLSRGRPRPASSSILVGVSTLLAT